MQFTRIKIIALMTVLVASGNIWALHLFRGKPSVPSTADAKQAEAKRAAQAGHRSQKSTGSGLLGFAGTMAHEVPPLEIHPDTKNFLFSFANYIRDLIKDTLQEPLAIAALQNLVQKAELVNSELETFLSSTQENDIDLKESAASASPSTKKSQAFFKEQVSPLINEISTSVQEIEKGIKTSSTMSPFSKTGNDEIQSEQEQLHESLSKATHEKMALLEDLKKFLQQFNAGDQSTEPSLSLSPQSQKIEITEEFLITIKPNMDDLVEKLKNIHKKFKELDSAFSGVIADQLEIFIQKLKEIPVHFKQQLRDVIGYTALISMQKQIIALMHSTADLKAKQELATKLLQTLDDRIDELNDMGSSLVPDLREIRILLGQSLSNFIKNGSQKIDQSLAGAHDRLKTLIDTKGGLVSIVDQLAQSLSDTFGKHFAQHVVHDALPKTAKKMAGYAVCAAMAFTSLRYLYLKRTPQPYHYAKGIGGFLASVLAVPVVDKIVDYFYR